MPDIVPLNHFLWGVAATAAWAVGLLFLRFWRETRDRLLLLFAVAFWMLSAHWLWLVLASPSPETRHYSYVARLAAFMLIIWAIVEKNRSARQ